MDCSTDDLPTAVAHDSPGKDSSCLVDVVPLSKLLKRPHTSDHSSDDEPLSKIKTNLAVAEKTEKKENASSRSNGTNKNADDGSDNEPLIKIAKVSSEAAGKPLSVPLEDTKKKASNDSSDDEPLTAFASAKKTEENENASSKSNNSAGDSSDNEPLIKIAKVKSVGTKKKGFEDSSDDEPLINLKTKFASAKKPEKKEKTSSQLKNNAASDDSSDDEPLIHLKTKFASAEKPEKKEKTSSKSNINAGSPPDDDDSLDEEPLIEISKKLKSKHQRKKNVRSPEKASPVMKSRRNVARKKVTYAESSGDGSDDEPPATVNQKKTKATKNNNAGDSSDNEPLKFAKVSPKKKKSPPDVDDDDNLDDEPLSEISKRLKSKHQTKISGIKSGKASPVMKSRRNVAREKVAYAESSSEDSDDEPLATLKQKKTKAANERKTPASNKKKTGAKRVDKSRKGLTNESSVTKKDADKRTKTKSAQKRDTKKSTPPRKPRKKLVSELISSSSDDELLINAARHPHVTKFLRIMLERCDGDDVGPTGSQIKPSTAETVIADEATMEESKVSMEPSVRK